MIAQTSHGAHVYGLTVVLKVKYISDSIFYKFQILCIHLDRGMLINQLER